MFSWLGEGQPVAKRNRRKSSGYGQQSQPNTRPSASYSAATFDPSSLSSSNTPSPSIKQQKQQPSWSPHSRRVSTFEHSTTSTRANFQKEGLRTKFENVSLDKFNVDRRRAHRDNLAKKAADRKTKKRGNLMANKEEEKVNEKLKQGELFHVASHRFSVTAGHLSFEPSPRNLWDNSRR